MTRSMSRLSALGLVVVVACGAPSQTVPSMDRLLYVRTAAGLAALGAPGAPTVLGDALIAPDSTVVVAAESAGEATVVRYLGLAGEVFEEISLHGELSPRVVAPGGDFVALGRPRASGAAPYLPEGKTETQIVVLDRGDGTASAREYVIDGNFEPEAFSSDGTELFLVEFVPAAAPERYQVRRLRLATGNVEPIGRLKTAAPEQMQGTGRTQVYSPHGRELYTLYTQQDEAGHPGGAEQHGPEGERSFVHLLSLEEGWAHCIDLPRSFGSGNATASAMSVSPDAATLYVVDWSHGALAVVRPSDLSVVRTVSIDFGAPDDETFAATDGERLYVGGGDEVVVLALPSLDVVDRWDANDEIRGISLAPDGSALFLSTGSEILELDARTGAPRARLPAEGAGAIEFVGAR